MIPRNERGHITPFDKDATVHGPLGEAFRIFAKGRRNRTPATHLRTSTDTRPLVISVAGAKRAKPNQETKLGGGLWVGPNDPRNESIRIEPSSRSDFTAGIFAAIARAAEILPGSAPLLIRIPSERVVKDLTINLKKNEDLDWLGDSDADIKRSAIANLRKREGWTCLVDSPLSGTNPHSHQAKRLANHALDLPSTTPYPEVPNDFALRGAKLTALSQKQLYRKLMESRKHPGRRATEANLSKIKAVGDRLGRKHITDAQIWKASRSPDLLRGERAFLFKTLHNAHRIGEFWSKIPNYEDRAECKLCNKIETMEHTLKDCPGNGSAIIWNLARTIWETKTTIPWPGTSFDTILASFVANLPSDPGGATSRFYRILMSTSSYLIWVIRCERRIQREDDPRKRHSEREIHNRWVARLNHRLHIDQTLTNKIRYGKKAVSKNLVLKTWDKCLLAREGLKADWIRDDAVLVSIRPLPPEENAPP
ncbi:hypothetical protein PUNSTDRAFT_63959 [Punctularia strigosozonata HHB-11173 SS5]|uniref:uncharacterized protein n=1 Tax=Punctularia strigosozonata (strain HHB-11173) TaxID=741275 RepID=UPI0004416459|nr:uncharacterized protein PUNSTDRAFT_63959 [Punctularia strigosozonata HHB-11173 SS5]EIN10346.1 hypothetical protein PUNSTDRAFT_63959 [Punctularia strigosozonata HHB-11173 SS5]